MLSSRRLRNLMTKYLTCYHTVDPSRLLVRHNKEYQFKYKATLSLQLLKRSDLPTSNFHPYLEKHLLILNLYGKSSSHAISLMP